MTSLTEWISPALGLSAAFTVNPNTSEGDTFCILLTFFFFFELREEEVFDKVTEEESVLLAPPLDFFCYNNK